MHNAILADRKELIREPVRFMAWILAFEAHSTNGVLWVGLSALEVIKAIAALRVVARDFVTTRIDVLLAEEERILREERQKSNASNSSPKADSTSELWESLPKSDAVHVEMEELKTPHSPIVAPPTAKTEFHEVDARCAAGLAFRKEAIADCPAILTPLLEASPELEKCKHRKLIAFVASQAVQSAMEVLCEAAQMDTPIPDAGVEVELSQSPNYAMQWFSGDVCVTSHDPIHQNHEGVPFVDPGIDSQAEASPANFFTWLSGNTGCVGRIDWPKESEMDLGDTPMTAPQLTPRSTPH